VSAQGRYAELPESGYEPERRRISPSEVLFISEDGEDRAVIRFGSLDCSEGVQVGFADAFERAAGPGGTRRTLSSAQALRSAVAALVESLNTNERQPKRTSDITPADINAFRLAMDAKTGRNYLTNLRLLARHGAFAEETKQALIGRSLPTEPHKIAQSYDDALVRRIERAARNDIRAAHQRISQARALAQRVRDRALAQDDDRSLAEALHHARLHGAPTTAQAAAAGMTPRAITERLHLTSQECSAFLTLLVALTGANAGTVLKWPAEHFRADAIDADDPAIAIVRSNKPRLGKRSRFNRVLVDLPEYQEEAVVPADDSDESDNQRLSLRTGVEVYLLLTHLTADTRRHGNSGRVFCYLPRGGSLSEFKTSKVGDWASAHGFKVGQGKGNFADSEVNLKRLRLHRIERTHKPTDHSENTMRRDYLSKSSRAVEEGFGVVRDALDEQVRKAREHPVQVFLGLPANAADASRRLGTSEEQTRAILAGEQDTVATACADFHNSPHERAGEPCGASFLTCLDCANARALPRHLPAQVALLDELRRAKDEMPLKRWVSTFAARVTQLEDILSNYTAEEVQRARDSATDRVRRRCERLVQRHLEAP
jgi:hypothetical protein